MPETIDELRHTLDLADEHTKMLMERIAHLEKCILENHAADSEVIESLRRRNDDLLRQVQVINPLAR